MRPPARLLHVALALVHKVQLRRQVTQVVTPARRRVGLGVVLERQIPERDLVGSEAAAEENNRRAASGGGGRRRRAAAAAAFGRVQQGVVRKSSVGGAWSSAPATAIVDDSCGDHSTEVIGPRCHVKSATGSPERIERKSQT